MNFTPKYSYRGSIGPDGNVRINQWDFSSIATLEIFNLITTLLAYAFIGALISPFLVILLVWYFDGSFRFSHIIGILVGSYFLYDCAHPGIFIALLNFFLSEKMFNILIILNTVAVTLHIILLLFGNIIHYLICTYIPNHVEDYTRQFVFLLMVGIITLIVAISTNNYLMKRSGWLERNLDETVAKIHEPS